MVIKALAVELYRAQQKVRKLMDQFEKAALAEKEGVRQELRSATNHWGQMIC